MAKIQVNHHSGVVIVERTIDLLKGFQWFPGGRIMRGVSAEESLKNSLHPFVRKYTDELMRRLEK